MSNDSNKNSQNEHHISQSSLKETQDNFVTNQEADNLLTLLNINIVSTIEEFKSLKEAWNKLNSESHNGTIFISWEWLYTWWEVYKNDGNRKLYILCCYDHKNELVGIAPFQIVYNPKRYFPSNNQLLFLGTGETDGSSVFGEYMDLLIRPEHESSVINTFSEFLFKHRASWDGLKFHQLLSDSNLSKLFKNQPDKMIKTTRPYGVRTIIDLPDSYKDYLMSLRKKMRNNITRTFSRLESEQEYTLEQVDSLEEIDESISILAELNRERREVLEQSSAFQFSSFESFHQLLAKRLLPLDKIRLRILRFDNQPVAALYSFLDGNTLHVYQSGFEKAHGHRYSLLTMMLTQEISKCIEDNKIDYFNFMFSENETTYKKRYSSETEPMYDISYDKAGLKFKLYAFLHGTVKPLIKRLMKK